MKNSWGPFDVLCMNGIIKIPELASVRIGLFDDANKIYRETILWEGVKRLGLYDPKGVYFELDLCCFEFSFRIEFADFGDGFVLKLSPLDIRNDIYYYICAMLRWGTKGSIRSMEDNIQITSGGSRYDIHITGRNAPDMMINNATHPGAAYAADAEVYVLCNCGFDKQETDRYLAVKNKEAGERMSDSGGALLDACSAVYKGIAWNTHYDPTRNRWISAISRKWCSASGVAHGKFGSYFIPVWDTFFMGLLCSLQDKEMAYMQFYNILEDITSEGMVPCATERGNTLDRSQPPVGSYLALKVYRQFGEKKFLENIYKRLLDWNGWWMRKRDGNGDGMLEWGSDPLPGGDNGYAHYSLLAAKYESGLDNSPMYDDVIFNKDTHTMELTDIGLNSLYALDTWALIRIAHELGDPVTAKSLEREYKRICDSVNEKLWNNDEGIYMNKDWKGDFSNRISPACFYPMIAGIATDDQAKRLVNEHLLNEKEFWGNYVIPSVSKSDISFNDNNYWRGRIWGPMNFLVSEGLKRYGYDEVAYDFAKKSLDLFMLEWKERSHLHENYNAITGEGCDSAGSDPIYFWGGLLAYLATEELVEARPFDGIRFGNLNGENAYLKGFSHNNDLYDIVIDNGMSIYKNGVKIIKCSEPVMLTDFVIKDKVMSFELKMLKNTVLTFYPVEGYDKVIINIRGAREEFFVTGNELSVFFAK